MDVKTYDYIVVGSGFGGSVSAMRLAEKGHSTLILEKGKKFESQDFPKSNWDLRKYLWIPSLRCFGIQKLTFFKDVLILSGVGVGGGSLVYANTLMVPPEEFFKNAFDQNPAPWQERLRPFYEIAKKMLGVTTNTQFNDEDKILKEIAKKSNRSEHFRSVDVGVYFGDPDTETDPYFGGLGPKRSGCTKCAGCMIGCQHNAKNTLDKNYLFFAQKYGAKIQAEVLVEKIEYIDDVYHLTASTSTLWFKKKLHFKSKGLVIAGGVLGTMDLLLKQKYKYKTLPHLSDKLGENILTNSESLCAVTSQNMKLNNGVAITSIYNPTASTHVELVKYPDGSNAMKLLSGPAVNAGGFPLSRCFGLLKILFFSPGKYLKLILDKDWAKKTVIFLVMQTDENSMKMNFKRFPFFRISLSNKGKMKVPSFIKEGQDLMEEYAKAVNGTSQNALTELVFDMSSTAHILGGAPMGTSRFNGVISEKFEAFGYPNMYILDGSIIPKNLGVNPSLTITALSEYAMSFIPRSRSDNNL